MGERDRLVAAWKVGPRAEQIASLGEQVVAAEGDLVALSELRAEASGTEVIRERMELAAAEGVAQVRREAAEQGVSLPDVDDGSLGPRLASRAEATAALLANSLSSSAQRRAVALSGGGLEAATVATEVRETLSGLSDAFLEEQLGGSIVQATNEGRRAQIGEGQVGATRIYASELLDANTCGPCRAVDGREFGSLAAAEGEYPTGGYRDCEGGLRCRGTLVAVFDEAPATV